MYFFILTNISTPQLWDDLSPSFFYINKASQSSPFNSYIMWLFRWNMYSKFIFPACFPFILSRQLEQVEESNYDKIILLKIAWNMAIFLNDNIFNTWNLWKTRCSWSGQAWYLRRWIVVDIQRIQIGKGPIGWVWVKFHRKPKVIKYSHCIPRVRHRPEFIRFKPHTL